MLWVKIVAAFLAIVSLAAAFCATGAARAADREALWGVVRACVSTHELTGGAFPCLSVDVSEGEERGFVVLRPPFGAPDTILAPTRKITGVEDPWLTSPEAPNYFAAAWNALPLSMAGGGDESRQEGAVAINSKAGRSQDQLHIHMGCPAPGAGEFLAQASAKARIGEWTRLPTPILAGITGCCGREGDPRRRAAVSPRHQWARRHAARTRSDDDCGRQTAHRNAPRIRRPRRALDRLEGRAGSRRCLPAVTLITPAASTGRARSTRRGQTRKGNARRQNRKGNRDLDA